MKIRKVLFFLKISLYIGIFFYSSYADDFLIDIYKSLDETNIIVKKYYYSYKKQDALYKKSISSLFPTLSLQQTYTRNDPKTVERMDISNKIPIPGVDIEPTIYENSYKTSFVLSWNLFNASLYANIKLNRILRNIESYNFKYNKLKEYNDIISNIYDLLLKELDVEYNYNKFIKDSLSYLKTKVGKETQLIEDYRLNLSKINYNLTKIDLNNSIINLRNTKNQLKNKFIEIKLDTILYSDISSTIKRIINYNIDKENWKEKSTLIKIQESSHKIKELTYRASYYQFVPIVNLTYLYGWQENNTIELDGYNTWSLRITLTWTLFNPSYYYNITSSYYDKKSSYYNMLYNINTLKNTEESMKKNIKELKKSWKQIEDMEKEYNNILEVAKSQYQDSIISYEDYLDTYLKFLEVKKRKIQIEKTLVSLILTYISNNLDINEFENYLLNRKEK